LKKAVRLIITCPNCREFFSLSIEGEYQSRNTYYCPNCTEELFSSNIHAALNNAREYNNLIDWFENQRDIGIELSFDDYR